MAGPLSSLCAVYGFGSEEAGGGGGGGGDEDGSMSSGRDARENF